MTSHPKDATQKLFDTIAKCSKIVRHVHLPVQAGNNRILKKMNRGYTKEEYLDKIQRLRSTVTGVSITSDIIVGFPTETDEEFADTLDVIRQVEFDSLYTFIFSKRKGTPAYEMEGQIEKEKQHKRFELLIEEQNRISKKINDTCLHTIQRVLVEGPSRNDPAKMSGRTDANKVVHLDGTPDMVGRFVPVLITGVKTWYLMGEVLTK
jgi:tRNA-2-methylthio-N6-dimethylallyladenosine synthase